MKRILCSMLIMLCCQYIPAQNTIASLVSSRKPESLLPDLQITKPTSDSIIINPPAALLTIPNFYVRRNKSVVELTWQPATEESKSVFIIQRKCNREWKTIAHVPCSSTSDDSMPSVYTYIDVNPYTGTTQYKIKEVVIDGNTRLSDVVKVSSERSQPFAAVYQQSTQKVRFTFKTESLRDIKVFTNKGQLLHEKNSITSKSFELPIHATGTLNLVAREQSTGAVAVKKIYIK
ncbi:MAG TPA: hypothetical protein VM368_02970 [Flavisolibacter sp.]|nr:hypothetical protein [Flavisolibacter sp.]